MPMVNVDRVMPKLDPWIESTRLVQEGRRKTDSSTLVLSDERRSSSPPAKTIESKPLLDNASSVGSSNSKVELQRSSVEVKPGDATIELTGSQASIVGQNRSIM
jgi:hypothetical protein